MKRIFGQTRSLKSNTIKRSDRKPLNRAKNNKLMECGHAARYKVLDACIACGERP